MTGAPRTFAAGQRDLLFEIGVEELPSSYVLPALAQLEEQVRAGLEDLRLAFGTLAGYATPRRLALHVTGLADRQADHEEEAQGPAVRVAYDGEGRPTRALIGFCRGKGVDPATVRRVETPKGAYVAVTVHSQGRPAREVLPPLLSGIGSRLQFPKSMRWLPDPDVRFARPVRWLVALLDEEVLPVRAFGIEAGRATQGHRFLSVGAVEIVHAARYLATLEQAHVIADHRARARRITERLAAIAQGEGGVVVPDEELVEINSCLVEWPTAFAGKFDDRYLDLPREVIVTTLREHQRFFAVQGTEPRDGEPRLLSRFVALRNGDERGLDRVRRGNEEVLSARLEDAKFYWDTDLKRAPEQRVESLASVVWMEGLGSLRDKAARLEVLAGWLAARLDPAATETATRAARLCKTDLLSEMIGSGKEYAGLQGHIGGYYAEHAGEPRAVADAIYWHYHPRWADDDLPATAAGALLSLADKLDHVTGAFVADKAPTGSMDPLGVRRAGNGVARILIEQGRHLDLHAAAVEATRSFFATAPQLPQVEILRKLGEFWRGRVESALEERGVPYDTREAAVEARIAATSVPESSTRAQEAATSVPGAVPTSRHPGWIDPWDCLLRAEALTRFRDDPRFEPLALLFKRVGNILRAATETIPLVLDRALLVEPAEHALLAALEHAREGTDPLWARRAYAEILPALLAMEEAIHAFFDHVLVNAEDMPTRFNRLRLLTEVRELFLRGWDLSRVVVEGERG